MSKVKEMMSEVILAQPEDASFEEILRELAFEKMVEKGLADSRENHVLSHADMAQRIQSWSN